MVRGADRTHGARWWIKCIKYRAALGSLKGNLRPPRSEPDEGRVKLGHGSSAGRKRARAGRHGYSWSLPASAWRSDDSSGGGIPGQPWCEAMGSDEMLGIWGCLRKSASPAGIGFLVGLFDANISIRLRGKLGVQYVCNESVRNVLRS